MAFKTSTEIKVGLFVLLAFAALVYMTLQVGRGVITGSDTYTLYVHFDNVSGLKTGAPVEIAGIQVGSVSSIDLRQGRARLTLSVDEGVEIRANATAYIKTRGVLGDKYIEIAGGSADMPLLADGDVIAESSAAADMGKVFEKIGQIADDVGLVAKSLANVIGGEEGERDLRDTFASLRDMTVSLNELVQSNVQSIKVIVDNMETFSSDMKDFAGDMSEVSGANKQSIGVMIANFEEASKQMNSAMDRMNKILGRVDEGRGTLGKMVADEKMGEDLKQAVASLENVARKIDEGQGTLGKLVNDKKTGEELDKALENVNSLLAKQEQFRTRVDFHSEFMTTGDVKSYLNLEIQPSEDKYYLLGLVDDPKGRTETTETVTRTRVGGGPWVETKTIEKETEKDGLKFNAQIAKRWDDLVLRGGIFESTGGAGVDYYFWDDRMSLFFEAFDFDDDDPPHLKTGLKIHFLRNFYATLGMDDFVGDENDQAFFGSLGIRFTDDDLKFLLMGAPAPSVN